MKRRAESKKNHIVEIQFFEQPWGCCDVMMDVMVCKYCELVCDSKIICEKKIQEIKGYLRHGNVLVNDFSHVSKVELSWIFRLCVSAYREIRRVEFIDERLILKKCPMLDKI